MEHFRIGLIPITWRDLVDIAILTFILYGVLRWFHRMNLLGVAVLFLVLVVFLKGASLAGLATVSFLLRQALGWIAVILAVSLAPELRRQLYALRFSPGLRFLRKGGITAERAEHIAQELVEAAQLLSKNGLGALVVLEGTDDLSPFVQTGDALQMPVENRMFLMIFEKKSPLHDGAVIVRGDRIIAARCTLPLSERLDLPQSYGQRHRAALGISEQSDAFVLVVSEETGLISMAHRGELRRMAPVELKKHIIQFYTR